MRYTQSTIINLNNKHLAPSLDRQTTYKLDLYGFTYIYYIALFAIDFSIRF